MNPYTESTDQDNEVTQADMAGFAKVAKHFPPSLIYQIAEEMLDCNHVMADQVIEVCFDIERGNNGAKAFISYMANLPV